MVAVRSSCAGGKERAEVSYSPHLRSDAHRNANDVLPWHELAKAEYVGKFPISYPAAVLDRDAARPDNSTAAADTAERDEKKRGEEGSETNNLLHILLSRHVGHLRSSSIQGEALRPSQEMAWIRRIERVFDDVRVRGHQLGQLRRAISRV